MYIGRVIKLLLNKASIIIYFTIKLIKLKFVMFSKTKYQIMITSTKRLYGILLYFSIFKSIFYENYMFSEVFFKIEFSVILLTVNLLIVSFGISH